MMMKKAMLKKLKSRAGETLVETLFAILIATFASILLAGATTTAMELNRQARERDERNQKCLKILSNASVPATSGKVKVTIYGPAEGDDEEKLVKSAKEFDVSFTDCDLSGEDEPADYGDYSTYVLAKSTT